MEKCEHKSGQILWQSERFNVFRCNWGCGKVLAYLKDQEIPGYILEEMATVVKPWMTNKPKLGLAYHWRHDGLWHSTDVMPELETAI